MKLYFDCRVIHTSHLQQVQMRSLFAGEVPDVKRVIINRRLVKEGEQLIFYICLVKIMLLCILFLLSLFPISF